eukprot:2328659-Prymnesium_polylepis.1
MYRSVACRAVPVATGVWASRPRGASRQSRYRPLDGARSLRFFEVRRRVWFCEKRASLDRTTGDRVAAENPGAHRRFRSP